MAVMRIRDPRRRRVVTVDPSKDFVKRVKKLSVVCWKAVKSDSRAGGIYGVDCDGIDVRGSAVGRISPWVVVALR